MAFCKIQVVGNLGRDPELRYTPNGRPVTEFSVAVNQATKNQQTGEWVEATDWFRVSVWGDRAERSAEQLRKGSRVLVDGRFRTREYETKDGRKGLSLEDHGGQRDPPRPARAGGHVRPAPPVLPASQRTRRRARPGRCPRRLR